MGTYDEIKEILAEYPDLVGSPTIINYIKASIRANTEIIRFTRSGSPQFYELQNEINKLTSLLIE